jgi:MarR family transcriptional regulator, negative regulator of the multidrug operon emrRAB
VSPTEFDRGANRIGALALRLTDRMQVAVTADGARSPSAAAALSTIERFFVAGPTIDDLRQVLGLTSSGVVRLVDQLEAEGSVARERGEDGRVTIVTLTASGRRRAREVVDARADVLVDALAGLSRAERATLARLVDKVLVGLVRSPSPGPAMCRWCATEVCGAERGQPCPVTRAALG